MLTSFDLTIALILFTAAFTQSLSGFGMALVSVPLLVPLLGVRHSAALLALIAMPIQLPVLIRYWSAVQWQPVWRLSLAMALGIPLGVFGAKWLNAAIMIPALGVLVAGYALYALFMPDLPEIKHPALAFPFGFVGGLLGGAYSTGGPPLIIYGNLRGWDPAQFKSSLQAIFTVSTVVQLTSHALAGNLPGMVLRAGLIALPAIAIGIAAGLTLDRIIKPETFRKIALVLLVIIGIRLIFS